VLAAATSGCGSYEYRPTDPGHLSNTASGSTTVDDVPARGHTVILRVGGGMVKGELLSADATHATVVTRQGPYRAALNEVQEVEILLYPGSSTTMGRQHFGDLWKFSRHPETGAPPSAPAPSPAGALPAPAPETVIRVEIRAPTVWMERNDSRDPGGNAVWTHVCQAPCNVALDRSPDYRIAGPRMIASEPFSLPARAPGAVIDVDPASSSSRTLSFGLTVTGGAMAGTGLVATAANLNYGIGYYYPLLALSVAGAGALVAGYTWYRSLETTVTIRELKQSSRSRIELTPAGLAF
jgi:hypothetical protein